MGDGSLIGRNKMPTTVEEYDTELSTADKLKVYNHVIHKVQQSKALVVRSSSANLDECLMLMPTVKSEYKQQEKSRFELMAEERDFKRRRASYRTVSTKNTLTTRF